ncbi:efflux RND transporter periplasmic adaptor subunit [Nonomuraea sp. NPDC050478]|uniref:efflux RND transporter periplasmic adaptor subunit n=1 Tax=Nonomuraea sp. NPDC050478 TaxID=3364365 RepID=UPI0037AD98C6
MGTTTIDGEALETAPRRRRGRRAAWLTTATVLAGAVAAAGLGLLDRAPAGRPAAALPPATATIAEETLRDTREADGELGFGPAASVTNRMRGTVTWLPGGDDVITRGEPLYKVDDDPVVLMYGSTPAYRDLAVGAEGRDVASLERNLSKLGYDGFTVDDTYTWATARAVMAWQEDRGLPETGVVELGRVVFADGKVRVDTVDAETGRPAAPGQKVLGYTGTAKVVTVQLDSEDRRLAKEGAKVTVTLPGGQEVRGKITEVATVIVPGQGNEEPQTKVEALVSLTGEKAADLDQAAVDVRFTAEERENVLTVPVAALVALREGGFGVEVVEGGATRYVPVETGLFSGGRVEITGDGLTEGMTVGMAK